MGATGLLPDVGYRVSVPIDPVKAWLNRHMSQQDVMRYAEWKVFCDS